MDRFLQYFAACLIVAALSGQSADAMLGSNDDMYDVIEGRCFPGYDCFPSQPEVAGLNNRIKGRVILPHMHEYINQSHMYNTLMQRYPTLIVMVHSAADIQEAILFGRKFNLHVTMRSSGHDYSGRSTGDGSLNINLSEMKEYEVRLDSTRSEHGEFQVQTGMTWAEIYKMLDNNYNRTIVGGSAHTVTSGGYTLGGGHSPISRSLGYAVDNLLEVQVVLADGSIATCTENETVIVDINGTITKTPDGDLFWAMKGGGGGTFGVVVYFVFRLHRMPAGMVTASTWFPMKIDTYGVDISARVLNTLGNLIKTMPREWGGYYLISNEKYAFEGVHITGSVLLYMNKFAPWDGTEEDVFKAFIELGLPYKANVTFANKTSFWDYEKDVYDAPIVRTYLVGTFLQPERVDEEFEQFIIQEFFTNFKDASVVCTGTTLGGRTTEFPVVSTPLSPGYRTAITCLSCGIVLTDAKNTDWFDQSKYDDYLIPRADAFSERLRKFGKGMYLNEPTTNNPHWKEDFWGLDHYRKLLEIKRRYDPDNFFTCHNCVGSDVNRNKSNTTPTPCQSTINTWTSGTTRSQIYFPLAFFSVLTKILYL